MSKLIGASPKVIVACQAFFEEAGEKITVPFDAVYKRKTRTQNKELHERLGQAMQILRGAAKEIAFLEQDKVYLSPTGKVMLVTKDTPKDVKLLTEQERTDKEVELRALLKKQSEKIVTEIKEGLCDIRNLENSEDEVVEYCEELLEEMLDNEGYFIALRDGLYRSTGVYEEQKTKNS